MYIQLLELRFRPKNRKKLTLYYLVLVNLTTNNSSDNNTKWRHTSGPGVSKFKQKTSRNVFLSTYNDITILRSAKEFVAIGTQS